MTLTVKQTKAIAIRFAIATALGVGLIWVSVGYGHAEEAKGLYWRSERALHSKAIRGARDVRPASHIAAMVAASARSHGVPVRLALGIIRIESNYRCGARNHHALGIGQVLPRTARAVGVHGNLLECRTGLEAAMRYLRLAVSRGGSGCAGASLYNLGIAARPRCTAYGRKVMRFARHWEPA